MNQSFFCISLLTSIFLTSWSHLIKAFCSFKHSCITSHAADFLSVCLSIIHWILLHNFYLTPLIITSSSNLPHNSAKVPYEQHSPLTSRPYQCWLPFLPVASWLFTTCKEGFVRYVWKGKPLFILRCHGGCCYR